VHFNCCTALVEIDATIHTSPSADCVVNRIENRIITRFSFNRTQSPELRLAEVSRLLSQYPEDVELLVLKKQNSIGAYFFCHVLKRLKSLEEMYVNGQIKYLLEKMFMILASSDGDERLVAVDKLTWTLKNYNQSLYSFHAISGKFSNSNDLYFP
jgi:hypothetical protein